MPDVATADFVGGADTDGTAGAGFGAEVALFLHDDYYAVAWEEEVLDGIGGGGEGVMGMGRGRLTDFGGAVHFEDVDAFGDGGAGVVDDIEHGLWWMLVLCMRRRWRGGDTLSWIMVATSLWWLATTALSRLLRLLHDLVYP